MTPTPRAARPNLIAKRDALFRLSRECCPAAEAPEAALVAEAPVAAVAAEASVTAAVAGVSTAARP